MLAQKLIRERQGAGIVFEVSKNLCLTFCVFGLAELPIYQHQIVVGAEILRIDRQDLSKAFKRTLIITFECFGKILRSEEHTSELQSQFHLVCRLLLE